LIAGVDDVDAMLDGAEEIGLIETTEGIANEKGSGQGGRLVGTTHL
jgi:hypothetical protein